MSDSGENDGGAYLPHQPEQFPHTVAHAPGIKAMNGKPMWKTMIVATSLRNKSEMDFIFVAIEQTRQHRDDMLSSATAEVRNQEEDPRRSR